MSKEYTYNSIYIYKLMNSNDRFARGKIKTDNNEDLPKARSKLTVMGDLSGT